MKKKLLKERTKRMSNSNGITLVALIITIVVLLILAVVAIGAVRNSGIIGHAQNASSGYNQAKGNEVRMLEDYETTISKYANTNVEEAIWGEIINEDGQLYLAFVGGTKNLKLISDKIHVRQITNMDEDGNMTLSEEIKERDINEYQSIGCINNNDIESIDFNNFLKGNIELCFSECTKLESVKGLNGVTSFCDAAIFYGCTSLKNVELPEGLTSLMDAAFRECSSLETVKLPSTLTYIDRDVFLGCTSLKSIEVPDNVTELLGFGTFSGCTSLTSIKLSNNLTKIGNGTFWNCSSLTQITIPEKITEIGLNVFEECNSLTTVKINKTADEIKAMANYPWDVSGKIYDKDNNLVQ